MFSVIHFLVFNFSNSSCFLRFLCSFLPGRYKILVYRYISRLVLLSLMFCFAVNEGPDRADSILKQDVLQEDSQNSLVKLPGFDISAYTPTYGVASDKLIRSEITVRKQFNIEKDAKLFAQEADLKVKPRKAVWKRQQKRGTLFDSFFFRGLSEESKRQMLLIGPWSSFIAYSEDSYTRSDGSYFDPYDDGYYYSKRRIPRWPIYDQHNRIVGYKEARFGRFVYSHADYHHLNFTAEGQDLDLSNRRGDANIFFEASERASEFYQKRQEYQEAGKQREAAEREAEEEIELVESDAEFWRVEALREKWWKDKEKELLPETVRKVLDKQREVSTKSKKLSWETLKKATTPFKKFKSFLLKERGVVKDAGLLADEEFQSLSPEELKKLSISLKNRDTKSFIRKAHGDVENVLKLEFDEYGNLDKTKSIIDGGSYIKSEEEQKAGQEQRNTKTGAYSIKAAAPKEKFKAPFKIYQIRKGGERVSRVGTFYDNISGNYSRETPANERTILSRTFRVIGFLIVFPVRFLRVFLQRFVTGLDNLGFNIPSRLMRFTTRRILARRVYPRMADDITIRVPMKNFLFKTLPHRFVWGDRLLGLEMMNAFFDITNFVNNTIAAELAEDDTLFLKYHLWQLDSDALECFPIRVPDLDEFGNDRFEAMYNESLLHSMECLGKQSSYTEEPGALVPYFWSRAVPGPLAYVKSKDKDFRKQPAPEPLLSYWYGATRPVDPRPFYNTKRWTFTGFIELDFEIRMYLTQYISSLFLFCFSLFLVFPISAFWHGFMKTARHGGFRYTATSFKMTDNKRARAFVINFSFWFFMLTGCYLFDRIVHRVNRAGSNVAPLTSFYSWMGQTWWNKRYELFAQKCVDFRRQEEEFSYNKVREHLDKEYRLRYYWKYLELGPERRDFLQTQHPFYSKGHGRPFARGNGFFDIEAKYKLHNYTDKPTTWFERYIFLHENRVHSYNQARTVILDEFREEAAEVKKNGRQMHWFRLWLYERRLFRIQKRFGPPVFSNDDERPGVFALTYSFLYDLDLMFRYRKTEIFQKRKTGQVNPYDAYGNFVPNWVEYYPEHVHEDNPIVHNKIHYYLWYDLIPYARSFGTSPHAYVWKERHARLKKINEDLVQAAKEINIDDIKATRVADEVATWGDDWKGWVEDIRTTVYRRQTFEDRKEVLVKELISDTEIIRTLQAYSPKSKLQSERHVVATNRKLDHLGPGTGREVPDEIGARLANKLLNAEEEKYKEVFLPPAPVVPK